MIVLEALSREFRLECPEELLYVFDLVLVSATLECLKWRLESWKGALGLKWVRVNVETKTMVRSNYAIKVIIESKFSCAFCRHFVDINSIVCLFCRCWVHKRCIRGNLRH